jgi:hypothetical protein
MVNTIGWLEFSVRGVRPASTVTDPHRSQSGACCALETPEIRASLQASILRKNSAPSPALRPAPGALTAVHATRDRARPEVMKIPSILACPHPVPGRKSPSPARFSGLHEPPVGTSNSRGRTTMIGIRRRLCGPLSVHCRKQAWVSRKQGRGSRQL